MAHDYRHLTIEAPDFGAVELPERAAPEPDEDEDEDEDEERHIVGYDEDGDPIYELGSDEPGQVPAQDE